MISNAEKLISKYFREIVAAYDIADLIQESENLAKVLSYLEYYLPEILKEKYSIWKYESLDGIFPVKVSKIGSNEAEIVGMCIFVSDQTLTPLHIFLKVNDLTDRIDFISCKLGENKLQGLMKIPYSSSKWCKYMYTRDVDAIDWAYEIKINKCAEDGVLPISQILNSGE